MIPDTQPGESANNTASGEGANSTQTTPKTPKAPKAPKTPKTPKTPKSAGPGSKKRKLASPEPKVEEEENGQPEWENNYLNEESKRLFNEISDPSFWDASQIGEV